MSVAPAGAPAGTAVEVAEAALREHLDRTVLRDKKLPFVSITVARRGAVVFEHAVTAPDMTSSFVLSRRRCRDLSAMCCRFILSLWRCTRRAISALSSLLMNS